MPLELNELESVRDVLRRMAWELNLEQPGEPVPPDVEGVDWGRGREAPPERVAVLNEIADLTNLLAHNAISTILLEANVGADLDAAVSSGLIERPRITFATDEGKEAWYEPLTDDAADARFRDITHLLSDLAALRDECGVGAGRESAFPSPWLSPDTLLPVIDYLRGHSTLGDARELKSWAVDGRGWEVWR